MRFDGFEDDFFEVMGQPQTVSCGRCGVLRTVYKWPMPLVCRPCGDTPDVEMPEEFTEDVKQPCYGSEEFWALEAEAGARNRKSTTFVREIEARANEQFCGKCPIREACASWALSEGYTGIAGGHLVVEGEPHKQTEGKSKYQPSKYHGVTGQWNRWRAIIKGNGNSRSLGFFDDEIEAARAFDRAVIESGGNPRRLNFPEEAMVAA